MIGINLSGAEFGTGTIYGRDYIYPGRSDLDFYVARGISLVRLPVGWERLQPQANGPLDMAELGRLKTFLADAEASGAKVIVDLHNYGRYAGAVLGTPGAPIADFAAFWGRLATEIATAPALAGYGLMNEPHHMGGADVWPRAAQAAIDAIRGVDAATAIYVAGDAWSGAEYFARNNQALVVRDPADNLIYEAHLYFDRYGAGTYAESYDAQGANPLLGLQRLQGFIKFLEANNARGFIGEVAVPAGDPRWLAVLDNFLAAAESANIDVAYWGGGPWWGNYPLAPRAANGEARPQLAVLERYAAAPVDAVVAGDAAANYVAGGRGADTLEGGDGDDTLRGRAGADRLDGGAGFDIAGYAASPRAVDVDLLRAVQAGGDAAGDTLVGIEAVRGSGFADTLRGDAGANALYGHGGKDVFEGRGGGDLIDGGWARDTVVYGQAVTIDLARPVQANGDRLVSIEDVTGSAFADVLMGDSRANTLQGGDGDDRIEGRGGSDTLIGGGGRDILCYASADGGVTINLTTGNGGGSDASGDSVTGFEDIIASRFDDWLRGDAGANAIDGGAGNDRLIGLGGADRLTGGTGDDRFGYTAVSDSRAHAPDIITDFTPGSDRIDLAGLDAIATRAGNQKFVFVGGNAFTAPGQLRIETGDGITTLFANTDTDLGADFALIVHSAAPLAVTDLLL